MKKFIINRWYEIWTITSNQQEHNPQNFIKFQSDIKDKTGFSDFDRYLSDGLKIGDWLLKIFDTKEAAMAAIPTAKLFVAIKANNLENELFETIELLKTKYVAFENHLRVQELTTRLTTLENKVNSTTNTVPTMDFDFADLASVKTFLTQLEQFQLDLFDGTKEKMEDFGGSLVWALDPADPTKIKEIEIHNLGASLSQIKIEDLNLTIIKHISDSILAVEKKIDDALGITLQSKLVQLGQAINIIVEDEPDNTDEVDVNVEVSNA